MTVLQLQQKLAQFIQENPNCADDEIYYYDFEEELDIDDIDIYWDLNGEGRYVCLI